MKNSKPVKNQRPSNPHQSSPEIKDNNRHVYIDPSFKVDLADDLRHDINTSQQDNATQNQKQLFWSRISAVAAISAAFFVGWQGLLLRDSNQTNRESLTSVQRAFITFQNVNGTRVADAFNSDPTQIMHHWEFSGVYENSGTTPARGAVNHFEAAISPNGEPSEQRFKGDRGETLSPTTIGPKATQGVGPLTMTDSAIFDGELGDISKLTSIKIRPNVYFWGWMAYRDVFSHPHITEFCKQVVGARLTHLSQGTGLDVIVGNCQSHNCTDQDCRDYEEIAGMLSRAAN